MEIITGKARRKLTSNCPVAIAKGRGTCSQNKGLKSNPGRTIGTHRHHFLPALIPNSAPNTTCQLLSCHTSIYLSLQSITIHRTINLYAVRSVLLPPIELKSASHPVFQVQSPWSLDTLPVLDSGNESTNMKTQRTAFRKAWSNPEFLFLDSQQAPGETESSYLMPHVNLRVAHT